MLKIIEKKLATFFLALLAKFITFWELLLKENYLIKAKIC